MTTRTLGTIAIGMALAGPLVAACTMDGSDSPPQTGFGGGGGSANGAGSESGSGGPSPQPMLVEVDTNRTMSARPGQGVGVFVEYAQGGHWHAWWTCDTSATGFGCAFDVTVSADAAITNVAGNMLEATDQLSQATDGTLSLITQTSTGTDGVTFDTAPGGIVTIEAKLNGEDSGALFFFVQDGAINGNYQGSLTDPLMFEPTTP
jgi:hypothetical protein